MKIYLALLLSFVACGSASANDYAWLDNHWIASSGTKLTLDDGMVLMDSCGSRSSTPYFVRTIEDGIFEFHFETATAFYFTGTRTEEGMCLTLQPMWNSNAEEWIYSDKMCFAPMQDHNL